MSDTTLPRGEEEATVRQIERAVNFLFPQYVSRFHVLSSFKDAEHTAGTRFQACVVSWEIPHDPNSSEGPSLRRLSNISSGNTREAALENLLRSMESLVRGELERSGILT